MKKHIFRGALIILGIVAIVIIALFMKDTRGILDGGGYEAKAPTDTKFARLSRWIPPETEFYVTVDVPKALSSPGLSDRLAEIIGAHEGVAADLVIALLQNQGSIGLMTVAGNLGGDENPPNVVVIAQGEFDEAVILPAIRGAMSEGKAGLTSMDAGWSTIYYESDSRRPFGFMILDDSHLAVGERRSLEGFYLDKPKTPEPPEIIFDDVLFGHVDIGPRLKRMIPTTMGAPESVDFSSRDGVMLNGAIACENRSSAMGLGMMITGIRSLLMLQQQNNPTLVEILEGIEIETVGNEVTFSTKLAPLMNLWAELDYEGDYRTLLDPHKSPIRELQLGNHGKPQKR